MIEYDLILIGITLIVCILIGVFEKVCSLNSLLVQFKSEKSNLLLPKFSIQVEKNPISEDISPTEL